MSTSAKDIPQHYHSAAYEKEKLVLATGGFLLSAAMFNNHATDTRYLLVMDAASTSGVWPNQHRGGIVEVPPGQVRSLDWSSAPPDMCFGIYVAASTSATTKTLPDDNDALFSVAYNFR